MASVADNVKYILMILDDNSEYSWPYPTPSAAAKPATHAVVDWSATFVPLNNFMPDSQTHFQNETMQILARTLHSHHYFTRPYYPWSNVTAKRFGIEVLRIAHILISKLELNLVGWPNLVHIVQSATNNSPSPARHNIAPFTALTSRNPSLPISTRICLSADTLITISQARVIRTKRTTRLSKLIEALHLFLQTSLMQNCQNTRDGLRRKNPVSLDKESCALAAHRDFNRGKEPCIQRGG